MPTEATSDAGEQGVMHHLNLGEPAMPDQPRPNFPIIGFAAGTPSLTADGLKRIEDLKPGDSVQVQPDDKGDGGPEDVHDEGCDCPDHDPRWWEQN
jgi:hypothetical protein